MVLIFSSSGDYDTNAVVKWLVFNKTTFVRINDDHTIRITYINFQTDDLFFSIEGKEINLKEVKSVWYRRGGNIKIAEVPEESVFKSEKIKPIVKAIERNLHEEHAKLVEFFKYLLEQKKCLTYFNQGDINKLIVLKNATKVGLLTPETFIVSRRDDIDFSSSLITKSMSSGIYTFTKINGYYSYTEEIKMNNRIPKIFFPTLIQKNVDKNLELRIFYLDGQFYPMAIFSQKAAISKIDNRKGNDNITIPYSLPENIRTKLKILMDLLFLNTGSIDMIVTKDNNYIFLEVNPVGQIGMTSYPCNYDLHHKIAKWLVN